MSPIFSVFLLLCSPSPPHDESLKRLKTRTSIIHLMSSTNPDPTDNTSPRYHKNNTFLFIDPQVFSKMRLPHLQQGVSLLAIPEPASQGRTDISEAGGRPAGGRRCDAEARHNYLSKPFIDGGRWKQRIQLQIPLHKSSESSGTSSRSRFVMLSQRISGHSFTVMTKDKAHGLILVTLIKLCWLLNSP